MKNHLFRFWVAQGFSLGSLQIPSKIGALAPGAFLLLLATTLRSQTVQLPIPELHTTASLTFEPVPGSPPPYLAVTIDPGRTNPGPAIAVTIDCLGHHERFLRKPDHPIVPLSRTPEEQIKTGVPQKVTGLTPNPSRLFFTTTGARTLLFFFSEDDASDAAPLYVLGFHPDGAPYRVLVSDHLDPFRVESGPGTDVRIYAAPAPSEVIAGDGGNGSRKPYATTYDPSDVYLVQGDNPAVLSATLTEQWNRRNYVWAPPGQAKGYAVVYNLPGHKSPVGATQQHAHELIDAATKAGQSHR